MAAFNADFTSFRAAVASWIDWTDSTITSLNDLIIVAENRVHKMLRTRTMESALAATLNSSGQATVPSDFIELEHAYIDGTPVTPLQRISLEQMYSLFPNRSSVSTNRKSYIAREGSNFIFGNAGSSGSVLKGRYFAKPVSLVSGATITSVFTAHPECYLFGALAESEPFIGHDERIQLWEAKFQQCIQLANQEHKDSDKSGSTLAASLG